MWQRATAYLKSTFGFLSPEKSHDEKNVKMVFRILMFKARASLLVRLGLFLNNFFSKGYFVK